MLLGTLGASLLGNILAGKGAIAKRQGRRAIKTSQGRGVIKSWRWRDIESWGFIRAGYGSTIKNKDF